LKGVSNQELFIPSTLSASYPCRGKGRIHPSLERVGEKGRDLGPPIHLQWKTGLDQVERSVNYPALKGGASWSTASLRPKGGGLRRRNGPFQP